MSAPQPASPATGGGAEVVDALKRVRDHLVDYANYHPADRTADVDAAIFCADEVIRRATLSRNEGAAEGDAEPRRWLARQLLDPALGDEKAYSVVAFHPAIKDARSAGEKYDAQRKAAEGGRRGPPDGLEARAICETLGFDPTNHHNALKCPYCNPKGLKLAEEQSSGDRVLVPREPTEEAIAKAIYDVAPDYLSTQFSGPKNQSFWSAKSYGLPNYQRAALQAKAVLDLAAAPASPADGGGREALQELVRAAKRYVECSTSPALTPYISENGRYGTKSPWVELREAIEPAEAALASRPAVEEKLVEALRPFAEDHARWLADENYHGESLTIGHFANARAALKAHGAKRNE